MELFRFAFHRLIAGPDRELAKRGLNRSHHRALHCIWRREGLTIAELADALAVTRQGLHRPLRQIVDGGLVEARVSPASRLKKQLWLTDSGRRLAERLANRALDELTRIFCDVGKGSERSWRAVMERIARLPDELI